MQGEPAIVVDDGVAGVGPALKADDHVGLPGQHIGYLALALVAPVGAYNRFYHIVTSGDGIRSRKGSAFSTPVTEVLYPFLYAVARGKQQKNRAKPPPLWKGAAF